MNHKTLKHAYYTEGNSFYFFVLLMIAIIILLFVTLLLISFHEIEAEILLFTRLFTACIKPVIWK